jgi:dihydroorotase
MQLTVRGGRVIDPGNGVDRVTDLHVADGRIAGIGAAPGDFEPARVLEATGRVVCPGLVDLRAHLREPGQEHKGTIASETRAAVTAGITTLCCPPDTDPVVDTPAVAELIHQRSAAAGMARVEVLGAMTQRLDGRRLAEMGALGRAGCVGISNAVRPVESTEVMRHAMEYAATFGLTVFLHAEDPWLGRGRYAHEGAIASRLGIAGIPETAETIALSRDLLLVEQTGVRAHFCHLSTARGVALVAEAQARGLPVTADVAAHHLHLTEIDTADFNPNCHLRPPLRTRRDLEGLRRGVADGVVNAITSDHQPHDADAKLNPFSDTEPGASGLETLLPLTLRLVGEDILKLPTALAALTCHPAAILGIRAGTLTPEAPADICIYDPDEWWTLEVERMASRGHNSPFLGWELKGRVTHTLCGGRIVYERDGG